jgi:hypothetical protein
VVRARGAAPLVRTALAHRATGVDPDPPAVPAARGTAVVAFVEAALAAARSTARNA